MTTRILRTLLVLLLVTASAGAATYPNGGPRSTDNDDSCDISQQPAATLLLPYFEVDLNSRDGEDTVFTLTNVGDVEQVARVTLWTDYAYPVINFNVFLTGYDVQSISLYDVIALGQIAPTRGTGFEDTGSPQGNFSSDDANPLVAQETCRNLPMQLASVYRTRMQQAFTQGRVPALGASLPACENIGGTHARATGYATIDVTRKCGILFPEDRAYFEDEILFDNILTGDYQQVDQRNDYAQGGPLVHIRAVPEGGTFASRDADPDRYRTNLERTFYSRYLGSRAIDARQPLPSVFAARWISGGPGAFQTHYKIWREGIPGSDAGCDTYHVNGDMDVAEIVRFDEDENFVAFANVSPIEHTAKLAATSRVEVADASVFPEMDNGAVAGWIYLNLDHAPDDDIASQAWVVSSMRAAGRFSVDNDVIALGNGCTPQVPFTDAVTDDGPPIGPAPNVNQH